MHLSIYYIREELFSLPILSPHSIFLQYSSGFKNQIVNSLHTNLLFYIFENNFLNTITTIPHYDSLN